MARAAVENDYVSPEALPGAVIDGKYRVDAVIGRGGVGLVVAATHVAIDQRVAIKMIRDDVPMQHELLDRFHREARAAVMIRSEHVARVLDVGRLPTGRPYIVMEYLEGEDLERVIGRGAMPCTAAVDLALQTCEALAAAHRAGIIHRDLKPSNLFLTRRPDGAPLIKVLDFGISKIQPLTAARHGRPVETTSIMGSPGYMAPEQMKSTRNVDARADIWSVGAVLYEMLVGQPAFEGSTMLEVLNAIATCDPIPPSQRQPGVPAALDFVIARCLAAEPEGRFNDVAELAVALQPFASPAAAGLAERVIQISSEALPSFEEPPFAALRSEPRPSALTVMGARQRHRSRLRVISVAAAGLCIAGALFGVFARRSPTLPLPDSFTGAPETRVTATPKTPIPLYVVDPVSPPPLPSPPPVVAESAAPSAAPVPSQSAASAASAAPSASASKLLPRRILRPAEPSATARLSPFGDRK